MSTEQKGFETKLQRLTNKNLELKMHRDFLRFFTKLPPYSVTDNKDWYSAVVNGVFIAYYPKDKIAFLTKKQDNDQCTIVLTVTSNDSYYINSLLPLATREFFELDTAIRAVVVWLENPKDNERCTVDKLKTMLEALAGDNHVCCNITTKAFLSVVKHWIEVTF